MHGGLHGYIFKRNNRESVLPDDANPYYNEYSSRKDEISIFGKMDYNIGDFTFYGDLQFRVLQLTINPDNTILPDEPDVIKPWNFLNPRIGISYQLRRTWISIFLMEGVAVNLPKSTFWEDFNSLAVIYRD